ncbi:hypothetical protein CDAR_125251 [Caerostris darwini]|uniref:Uncharacterized protein n=1 Tax=Caerostris darwini TaxID=1538125 RepID=A0AAV4S119_9ARAC|nr:hypothetical protein CDAR_125251 [Caerostris darwini]
MSLKGKTQQKFDLVIGSTPRYFRQVPPPPTPTSHRRCAPTLSFAKSKPLICDASPLKYQGTMPSKSNRVLLCQKLVTVLREKPLEDA